MPDVPIKEIGKDEVFAAEPEWKENYDAFQPRPESIQKLKSMLGNGLRIDIYLGLWCPDSRNNVPPFLKILTGLTFPFRSVTSVCRESRGRRSAIISNKLE
jgi:hypothetical protein